MSPLQKLFIKRKQKQTKNLALTDIVSCESTSHSLESIEISRSTFDAVKIASVPAFHKFHFRLQNISILVYRLTKKRKDLPNPEPRMELSKRELVTAEFSIVPLDTRLKERTSRYNQFFGILHRPNGNHVRRKKDEWSKVRKYLRNLIHPFLKLIHKR